MDTLLSIITMFNYDPTLFDDLVLPDELDKDLVTDNIMLELGELELLYNDPNMMKFAIGRWSSKELKKWEDLYSTTVLDYNPIENYNRIDDFTDTETRDLATSNTETRDLAETNNETRDLETGVIGNSNTSDIDVETGSNSVLKETSAYNAATLVTGGLDTETRGTTNTKTIGTDTTQTGTDAGTVNTSITDGGTIDNDGTDKGTVELRKVGNAKGNIGVTTTQQMIGQERGVVEFNIYDYILNSFKQRFCILVY